jgi:hypothetical protein
MIEPRKKDAGPPRPAPLDRYFAQEEGYARGEGAPRGSAERSESLRLSQRLQV